MNNTVIAVIVTYNAGLDLEKNIEILSKHVGEIVIVDNGSNSETILMLNSLKSKAMVISLEKNMGIAYALNRGIEYGIEKGYEWILTLDHDSRIDSEMIENMLETYSSIDELEKNKIAMITPIHVEEKSYIGQGVNKNNSWKYVLTEITSGAMVKASYYKEFGLYDESLFIDLVDHDYCLKINKSGYKIIQVDSGVLIHNLGESIDKNILGIKITPTNHSPLRRYYMTRNRFYIWDKYKKDFSSWVLIDKRRFLTETAKVVLFEKEKVKKIKMTLRGIKDYKEGKKGDFYEHK